MQQKPIHKTRIPIIIEDEKIDLSGLINFSSERNEIAITDLKSKVEYSQEDVMYKNQILRLNDN